MLLQEKMAFLNKIGKSTVSAKKDTLTAIFSQPLELEVIHALKVLTGVEGKEQVDMLALGLNAEDLSRWARRWQQLEAGSIQDNRF